MINLKHVFELCRHKKIKLVSESQYRQLWEVDGHTVIFQIKKGRRVLTCDCDNHTKFCGTPSICSHKEAVLIFPAIEAMQNEIQKKLDNIKCLKYGTPDNVLDLVLYEMEDLDNFAWVRQLKYR